MLNLVPEATVIILKGTVEGAEEKATATEHVGKIFTSDIIVMKR
jgi:hypothetical protein